MSHMPAVEMPDGGSAITSEREINTTAPLTGGGDLSQDRTIALADGGITAAKLGDNQVTLAKLADIATARLLGRVTASTGDPEVLTGTQATTLLDQFTSALKGLVPASGGGSVNFLRADGTWVEPPGAGSALGWYVVTDHGLVDDGTTDNVAALEALVATVLAAGGGTIYFPPATVSWHFTVRGGTENNFACLNFASLGRLNLRFLGAGTKSLITWGGDAGGADRHWCSISDGNSHLWFEKLRIVEKDLTNSDEQHHHFNIECNRVERNEHIYFDQMEFGVAKGDAIRLLGGSHAAQWHAVFAGNNGSNDFPGPFANPATPKHVALQFGSGYDGGNITLTGTDQNGDSITETVVADAGGTMVSVQEFATISAATKATVGASAATVSLGYSFMLRHVAIRDCYFNGREYEGSDPGYGYRAAISVQRLTEHVLIRNCFMFGSDDQLLDFEPTGEGPVNSYLIEGNIFVGEGGATVSLYGNGNTRPNQLHNYSVFRDNWVYGNTKTGKLSRVIIENNRFLGNNATSTESLLSLEQTCNNVHVVKNFFRPPSTAWTGKALRVEGAGGFYATGINIADNDVHFVDNHGIQCIDVNDLRISNNRVRFFGTTTAGTRDGINVSAPNIEIGNIEISGNTFGNEGSGSMRHCINVTPLTNGGKGFSIHGNRGRGTATSGVTLNSGSTFGAPPIIYDNSFPDATTPISIPTGVVVATGGNQNYNGQFSSSATPIGAVAAAQGARHVWRNTDLTVEFFKSVGSSNTGWQLREGPPISKSSGNLEVTSGKNDLSVTGTVAFTWPNGISSGQRMIVTCKTAASTPLGTVTVTTPHSGQPSAYLFTAVDQLLEGVWDSDWRVIRKVRAGSQTAVLGTDTISGMVSTVNLSVTGTVNGALPNGAVPGEVVQVRCTTAASSPDGGLTGAYKALDGTETTTATFTTTNDYFVGVWDGTHWIILGSAGVVFS